MSLLQKRITVFLLVVLLFALLAALIYSSVRTGYAYCMQYHLLGGAKAAFECGNHHFGVYGYEGYNVDLAERYFRIATEEDPTLPDAWHQYARIAFLRGEYTAAIIRINRQFEERGDELMASYYMRGLIYGYARDYAYAEADFKKFLTWDPTSWAANNDLAWIYFAQGKFAEASLQIEPLLAASEDNPWLLTMHAMSVYNMGDVTRAKEELVRAEIAASRLSEVDWLDAYPGNDPRVAARGLEEFRATIARNLELVNNAAAHSSMP